MNILTAEHSSVLFVGQGVITTMERLNLRLARRREDVVITEVCGGVIDFVSIEENLARNLRVYNKTLFIFFFTTSRSYSFVFLPINTADPDTFPATQSSVISLQVQHHKARCRHLYI